MQKYHFRETFSRYHRSFHIRLSQRNIFYMAYIAIKSYQITNSILRNSSSLNKKYNSEATMKLKYFFICNRAFQLYLIIVFVIFFVVWWSNLIWHTVLFSIYFGKNVIVKNWGATMSEAFTFTYCLFFQEFSNYLKSIF